MQTLNAANSTLQALTAKYSTFRNRIQLNVLNYLKSTKCQWQENSVSKIRQQNAIKLQRLVE